MKMKQIPKLTKKKREYNPHSKGEWIRKNIYNTTTWRYIREGKLQSSFFCERCEYLHERFELAEEVHHVVPISTGKTKEEMEDLAFDFDNLMAVCSKCHIEIHNEMKKNKGG